MPTDQVQRPSTPERKEFVFRLRHKDRWGASRGDKQKSKKGIPNHNPTWAAKGAASAVAPVTIRATLAAFDLPTPAAKVQVVLHYCSISERCQNDECLDNDTKYRMLVTRNRKSVRYLVTRLTILKDGNRYT